MISFDWTVCICCHNATGRISPTLNSINRLAYLKSKKIKVLIVDNNSSDDLISFINEFNFHENIHIEFIVEKKPGKGYAQQKSFSNIDSKYVAYVDDDNLLDEDYLCNAQYIFESDNKISFVGGQSFFPEKYNSLPNTIVKKYFSRSIAVGKQRKESGYVYRNILWGAGICLRMETVKQLRLGSYQFILHRVDKNGLILSGEDSELCLLLLNAGTVGYYSDDLKLIHDAGESRLNISYYINLFFGFGATSPVFQIYNKNIDLKLFDANKEALKAPKNVSKKDFPMYLCINTILGVSFFLGAIYGYLIGRRDAAKNNLKKFKDSLTYEN